LLIKLLNEAKESSDLYYVDIGWKKIFCKSGEENCNRGRKFKKINKLIKESILVTKFKKLLDNYLLRKRFDNIDKLKRTSPYKEIVRNYFKHYFYLLDLERQNISEEFRYLE
jgi:hypothetical protein